MSAGAVVWLDVVIPEVAEALQDERDRLSNADARERAAAKTVKRRPKYFDVGEALAVVKGRKKRSLVSSIMKILQLKPNIAGIGLDLNALLDGLFGDRNGED